MCPEVVGLPWAIVMALDSHPPPPLARTAMLPAAQLISLLSWSALSLSTGSPAERQTLQSALVNRKSCAQANRHHLIDLGGPNNAASIASINNFVGNGFWRYATQPASIAALREASLSLAVMNTTGSSIPERVN
jgi:hypothetical protein